tara:strand:- start:366 stop:545 length:180 start_codon:yes stop_codon:yes gene_type:complete
LIRAAFDGSFGAAIALRPDITRQKADRTRSRLLFFIMVGCSVRDLKQKIIEKDEKSNLF